VVCRGCSRAARWQVARPPHSNAGPNAGATPHTHISISISVVPSGLESQGNQRGFRNPRAGAMRRRSRLACAAVAVQQLGALDRNWLRWRRGCTRLPEVWPWTGCIPVSGKRSESRSPLVAHSPVSQQGANDQNTMEWLCPESEPVFHAPRPSHSLGLGANA